MEVISVTKIMKAKVTGVRHLKGSAFIIRMERNGMQFTAGQYIRVGFPETVEMREYSIYSGENDDYLEILVKVILEGEVSKKLEKCQLGDILLVDGPFGFFNIEMNDLNKKLVFIASGTGIAPFHSFVKSHSKMSYHLLHGVHRSEEAYEKEDYDAERYVLCATQDNEGNFRGRVTEFLAKQRLDPDILVYLCGNSNMIYDSFEILQAKGLSRDQMFTEAYF